ncbi:UNVERIFIED_CONTAM: LINE-1 retrotransposable element O protein [Sesamum radiatum]|uniref:LINE-1 retrotransposable element O protein n=1 Tax=Sesamum radiatum TaxID=300843 RepID=A0AAW2TEV0_SESRA
MLRDLLQTHKPDIIFLCEIKTAHTDKLSSLLQSSNLINSAFVPAFNKAGGLCLAWTPSINVNVILTNPWMINVLIFLNAEPCPWQFTGIHCPAVPALKPSFWHSFSELCSNFDGPWLAMGDFNGVMSQDEKRGGKPFASASRNALGDELETCNLIDLGFTGSIYTCTNKRPGIANIQSRLDRGVANTDWCLLYPKTIITHLPAIASDHCPLLLDTHPPTSNRPRPFYFEEMWFRDFSCESLVADTWFSFVAGDPMRKLHSLLKKLRSELRKWNHKTFGWCHNKIETIKREIGNLQKLDQTGDVLSLESNLQMELDEQFKRLETKWRQKAKQKWLEEGDANTKYFHLTAVLQSKANFIHSIQTRQGNAVTEWEMIGNEFSYFFKSLFQSECSWSQSELSNCVHEFMIKSISESDNQSLCLIPSPEEIRDTIFSMASFKSPGPDGFPPSFFKQYWHIVGKQFVEATIHFFSTGHITPAINHTYISLVPKNSKAASVDQFRPISLCNTTYKVISKILANRIKPHLEKIISPFQMAFVPGRNINDNSIISQEIMHYLHRKKGRKGFMAIKIDLSKAYDRVEWPFLLKLLEELGLNETFVNWISQCISSASFSLLINGAPFDFFRPSRGIRQGDPLSPYLFIIYAEFMSRLLLKEESLGNIKGIKVCRNAPAISHLFYADDLTIFCRADERDAEAVQRCLNFFEEWSSQVTNSRKSMIHFSENVPNRQKRIIQDILRMPECNHRVKHLGLPFCKPKSRTEAFHELLEKMSNKLSLWKSKNLSRAGKMVLIKNVAQSIPVYHMSTFLLPKSICNKMDSIVRRFWWQTKKMEPGKNFLALKSWNSICQPKSKGGLGFQKFFDFNEALLSKIAWNILQKSDKLWCQILSAKYLRHSADFDSNLQVQGASWIWQDVVKCAKILQLGACFTISRQSCIRIWDDPWIPSINSFKPPQPPTPDPNWPTLVRDLINTDGTQWNLEIISEMFPNHIVHEIRKIQIPDPLEPSRPFWAPSKSGKFTAKAAFQSIQQSKGKVLPEDETIGSRIWKLDLHNRLKLFIWRTLFDTLPTKGKLAQSFQISDPECLFCNSQVETAHHVFLCCPFTEKIWLLSKWQVRLHPLSHLSLREWFMKISDPKSSFFPDCSIQQEFITAWAITFELIWRARNERLHENLVKTPEVIARCIQRNTIDHCTVQKLRKTLLQINVEWRPPPEGWIKANTDIAFKENKCVAALIIRDHQGFIRRAAATKIFVPNASLAELRAIRLVVEELNRKNIEYAIFESDSLEAINWITGMEADADFAAQIDIKAIKSIWNRWPKWEFCKIPRLCNGLAHGIAKWAHGANWDGPIPPPMFPTDVICDKGPTSLERLMVD